MPLISFFIVNLPFPGKAINYCLDFLPDFQ